MGEEAKVRVQILPTVNRLPNRLPNWEPQIRPQKAPENEPKNATENATENRLLDNPEFPALEFGGDEYMPDETEIEDVIEDDEMIEVRFTCKSQVLSSSCDIDIFAWKDK